MARGLTATALLLPWLAAGKSVVPIMDWTLDYGFCKAAAPWLRREQLEPVAAEVGDIIDVRYAAQGALSGHDVLKYPDAASWRACDEGKATLLTADPGDGGGCATSHDFFCLASTPGKQIEVTVADAAAGGLWLAGSRSHCLGGVKLQVAIVSERAAERASGARRIVVPAWTDDYGFCESLGTRFADGVHRPHGLTSIWAFEGDALVWKYSSHHTVWRAPDYASARHCDIDTMTEVAGRGLGGGCDGDDSLGPWGSRAGRAWVDFAPMSGYAGAAADIKATGAGGTGLTLSEDDGALRIRGDLTDAIDAGKIHLHAGRSCADPGDHLSKDYAGSPGRAPWTTPAPTPQPRDVWEDGTVTGTAWSASGGRAPINIEVPAAVGLTLADAVGRVVVVHDAAGAKAVCGTVNYERPSGEAWADSCLADAAGFEYVLSLEDPGAVLVRDQPTQSWVGDGNAGADELFEAHTALSGAVNVHFVCQVGDHCDNGQRVTVYVLPRPGAARSDDDGEFEDPVEAGVLSLLVIIILALATALGYVYFVERPRYKASAQLELAGDRPGMI